LSGQRAAEKKINITCYREEDERAKETTSSRHAKWLKKKWPHGIQRTVEPHLGTLINTRGLKSAHKKMLMAACTYNLKKWLNFCSGRRKTAALVAPKPAVTAFFGFFW
jgi:hypothetical protein